MLHDTILLMFAFAGGLTLSGLVVTTYRLFATMTAENNPMVYYPVIAFAGPSVLMENVARSFRAKQSSNSDRVLAAAFSLSWAFAIGLPLVRLCGMH